jgi:hypothetical protein
LPHSALVNRSPSGLPFGLATAAALPAAWSGRTSPVTWPPPRRASAPGGRPC